jgi:hypothetical protein
MFRFHIFALVALIPVVVACGGSSSSGSSSPTAMSEGAYSIVFDAAVLVTADLPPGWTSAQSPSNPHEGYGDQLCSQIGALGNSRIVSWVMGKFKILSMNTYYYAPGQARKVLSENRRCTSPPRGAPAARGGAYVINALSVTALGDESAGYQFETDDKALGHVFAAGETIRRGDFVIALNVLSNESIDPSQLQGLASIADAKLAAVLGDNKQDSTAIAP